jgi:hypothetical protein
MSQHTERSSYRDKLVEHLFIGELMKLSWLHHECGLEVAKPEIDDSGYDIIAETKGLVRHIQIKTSTSSGKAANQKVHIKLLEKPSACVVWIYFNEQTMRLGPFRYFGAEAGKLMASLSGFKIGRHTKGNKDGLKAERPNIRVVPKGSFKKIDCIEGIYAQLFQTGMVHAL